MQEARLFAGRALPAALDGADGNPVLPSVKHRPIRHGGGSGALLLRRRLALEGPCRGGWLRIAANGPAQLYMDGLRVGGAPGGAIAENPLWQPLVLEGGLEAGPHEMVAVIGSPPDGRPPWFACHGRLKGVAGGPAQAIESDLRWQAFPLAAGEGFSALEDPPAEEDWEGVETAPGIEVASDAPRADERLVPARGFAVFEETLPGGDLSFTPASVAPGGCKCVHRDELLALSGRTSVLTGNHGAVAFVLDFGRVVTGYPCLRLREGRGGVVEIGAAASWGHIDQGLRYVCASGRQEWYGLTPVRCRYLVVRLSRFTEEVGLERLALSERFVPARGDGALSVSPGHDLAWEAGPPSLRGSRLDAYLTVPPPAACDWWGTHALLLADAVRTGHLAAGRATLLGRAPDPLRPRAGDRPFAVCLEAYHDYSGDADTLRRLLPAAVEAALREPGADAVAASLTEAVAAAAAAERLCLRAGEDSDAGRCREVADSARSGLEELWRPEQGLYADSAEGGFSQRANGLILAAAAAPEDRSVQMAAALRGPGVAPVAGLTEAVLLAEGLWRSGHGARALEVIDTWWLRIVGREGPAWRDKRGPEVDVAAPGPDYLLGRFLLGISPSEPGFGSRRVEPALSLADRARGRLPTPAGDLSVEWRTGEVEGVPRTTVRLEAGGAGETALVLDRGGRPRPTLSVNGEEVWRNEKIYANASVQEIGADPGALTLLFQGPGAWEVILE